MKAVLVVSEVTYMPTNYVGLYARLLSTQHRQIAGVVCLTNANLSLLMKALGLAIATRSKVALTLSWNTLKALLGWGPQRFFRGQGVPVFETPSINRPPALFWLRGLSPDILLNLRTRDIFKKTVLEIPAWGCFNLHHGLLPEQRGTLCDLWALSEGRPAGHSIHKMALAVDDGPIALTGLVDAGGEKNYYRYLQKTIPVEAQTLEAFLESAREAQGAFMLTPNPKPQRAYDKTPNWRALQGLRKKGMTL